MEYHDHEIMPTDGGGVGCVVQGCSLKLGPDETARAFESILLLLIAISFNRHTEGCHNADFEVCDDWQCKAAREAIAIATGERR